MSDIRFNRWLHQSGTGGVYQDSSGRVGIGTSVPTSALDVQSGSIKIGSNTLSSSGVSTFTTVNATTVNATSLVGVTTAGITTAYISSVNNGPISGSKNRIINGDFEIWQRGTSVTYLDGSTNFYLADRWSGTAEFQNARHQRVSIADTASGMVTRYALRASSSTTGEAASGTRIAVGQKIENVNMYDLRGKTITASFWVKFSAATVSSSTATSYGPNWNAAFVFPTTVDGSFYTTTPSTFVGTLQLANGALPTTWTKYSITATIPSNAGNIDLRFQFDGLGNTASADTVWYDITQVQLEEGPVASVFERRSYGQELALAQRYYQEYIPGAQELIYSESNGASGKFWQVLIRVPMRIAPNVSFSSGITGGAVVGLTGTVSSLGVEGVTVNRVSVRVNMSGNTGSANLMYHCDSFANDPVYLNAEL